MHGDWAYVKSFVECILTENNKFNKSGWVIFNVKIIKIILERISK